MRHLVAGTSKGDQRFFFGQFEAVRYARSLLTVASLVAGHDDLDYSLRGNKLNGKDTG